MPPTPRPSSPRALTRHSSPADSERAASFMRSFDALRSPQKQSLSCSNSFTQAQAQSNRILQLEEDIRRLSRERETIISRHGLEIACERDIAVGLRTRIASLEERVRSRVGEEERKRAEEKAEGLLEELNLEKQRRKELEKQFDRDRWDLKEGIEREKRAKERAKERVKKVESERDEAVAALREFSRGKISQQPLQTVDLNITSLRSPPFSGKTMPPFPEKPDVYSLAAHEHLKQQHKSLHRAHVALQDKYDHNIRQVRKFNLQILEKNEKRRALRNKIRLEELGLSGPLSETSASVSRAREMVQEKQGSPELPVGASGPPLDTARQPTTSSPVPRDSPGAEVAAPPGDGEDYSPEEEGTVAPFAECKERASKSSDAHTYATTWQASKSSPEKQPTPPREVAILRTPARVLPAPQADSTITSSLTAQLDSQSRASSSLSPFVRDRLGKSTVPAPVPAVSSLRKAALLRTSPDLSSPGSNNAYPSAAASSSKSTLTGDKRQAIDMEGLSPYEKAVQRRALSKMTAKEKRDLYKEYKKGGRYIVPEDLREDVTEEYEINPEQNEGAKFAFHDIKRNKTLRKQMHGGDCECCKGYYEAVGVMPNSTKRPAQNNDGYDDEDDVRAGLREHQNKVSRHRETWIKPPTPPGYWQIGFPDTQEVEEQNRKADEMAREKEARIVRETKQSESKWRKKT